jgi:hypothetical protein
MIKELKKVISKTIREHKKNNSNYRKIIKEKTKTLESIKIDKISF